MSEPTPPPSSSTTSASPSTSPPQNNKTHPAWILAVLLLLGLAGVFFYLWSKTDKELKSVQVQLVAAKAEAGPDPALLRELDELRGKSRELETKLAEMAEARKGLESRLKESLESRDVKVTDTGDGIKVEVAERVLFPLGTAQLLPEGREVLTKLAETLAAEPGTHIRIEGHSDNLPINPGAMYFKSNWELSAARATTALRFLEARSGIDPARLTAVAHGEHRPIAPNDTPENRAKNRRIEILLVEKP